MGKKNYQARSNKPPKQNRKRLLWVLLVILAITSLLFVLEKTGATNLISTNDNPSDISGPTSEEKKEIDAANAEVKKEVVTSDKGATNSSTTPSTAPTTKSISFYAKQETNNTVTVFTALKGYSDGSCVLTITNSGKTASQSADVIYQAEESICAGFSVPIDQLGSGTWTLKLSVTSDGLTNNKTIEYKVR